jgi:hypothetical protein
VLIRRPSVADRQLYGCPLGMRVEALLGLRSYSEVAPRLPLENAAPEAWARTSATGRVLTCRCSDIAGGVAGKMRSEHFQDTVLCACWWVSLASRTSTPKTLRHAKAVTEVQV